MIRTITVKRGRISFQANMHTDKRKVQRFVAGVPRVLVDECGLSLNALSLVVGTKISTKDAMKFYCGLGYSLCGFCDVFPRTTFWDAGLEI